MRAGKCRVGRFIGIGKSIGGRRYVVQKREGCINGASRKGIGFNVGVGSLLNFFD